MKNSAWGWEKTDMTGPELKKLAERRSVNPYYLAYALATGASSCAAAFNRDGGNHLYFAWNNDLWSQQAKAEGIGREWVTVATGAADRHIELCAAQIPVNPVPRRAVDRTGSKSNLQ